MNYAFRLTFMITVPAAVALSILSELVYLFLFPTSESYELMMYGSVVIVLMSITQIQNTVLQGVNKLYVILGTASLGLVIKFILNYILVSISSVQILGAIISNIFAFGIPMLINQRILQKTFKMKISLLNQCGIPLICSMFMGIVIFLMKIPAERILNLLNDFIGTSAMGSKLSVIIVLIPIIIVGLLVYFISMIYTGGIRRKDLDTISPKIINLMPKFIRKQIN